MTVVTSTTNKAHQAKPLVWRGLHGLGADAAYTPFGDYVMEPDGAGLWYLFAPSVERIGKYHSMEEADAAAQADWQKQVARFLATEGINMTDDLIPRTEASAMVAAALRMAAEACQREIDYAMRGCLNGRMSCAEDLQEAILALITPGQAAALDAMLAGARRVKPLVWNGADHFYYGRGIGFSYEILRQSAVYRVSVLSEPHSNSIGSPYLTLEAAKAAAQADYAARILAALEGTKWPRRICRKISTCGRHLRMCRMRGIGRPARQMGGGNPTLRFVVVMPAALAEYPEVQALIAAAVKEERERCAAVAEDEAPATQDMRGSEIADCCFAIAAAIRKGE